MYHKDTTCNKVLVNLALKIVKHAQVFLIVLNVQLHQTILSLTQNVLKIALMDISHKVGSARNVSVNAKNALIIEVVKNVWKESI